MRTLDVWDPWPIESACIARHGQRECVVLPPRSQHLRPRESIISFIHGNTLLQQACKLDCAPSHVAAAVPLGECRSSRDLSRRAQLATRFGYSVLQQIATLPHVDIQLYSRTPEGYSSIWHLLPVRIHELSHYAASTMYTQGGQAGSCLLAIRPCTRGSEMPASLSRGAGWQARLQERTSAVNCKAHQHQYVTAYYGCTRRYMKWCVR